MAISTALPVVMKARSLFAAFLAILAVSIIFMSISLATTHWLEHDGDANSGLFESCIGSSCKGDGLNNTPGWKKAVGALMIVVEMAIVAVLMIAVSLVIIPPKANWQAYTEKHMLPVKILLGLSVLLGFITLCIFAGYVNKYKDKSDEIYPLSTQMVSLKRTTYGYSYALGWLAELLAIGGMVTLFFQREYEPTTDGSKA